MAMENFSSNIEWLYPQIVGLVALVTVGIRWLYYQEDALGNLKMKVVGCCLLSFQFFLLGAWAGCVVDLLSAVQAYTFYRLRRTPLWTKKPIFLCLFVVLFAAICNLTWTGAGSLLPLTAAYCFLIADSQEHTIDMAGFHIGGLLCFLAYDLITKAYGGFLSDLISLSIVCVFKFNHLKERIN